METKTLDFSFDLGALDRQAILVEAARKIDALQGTLGDGDTSTDSRSDGASLRELIEDQARFAGFPLVHKLTESSFRAQQRPIPVRFSQLAREHNFYWLYFPIVLFPRHNWGFERLEMHIKLAADDPAAHLQPTAFQILPHMKFQTLIEATVGAEVQINENAEFEAKPIDVATPVGSAAAGVSLKAAAEMGMGIGPFRYHMKRAKIQHTAPGAERVFWRLDGAEFFQEDAPELVVIAQVRKEVRAVKIEAALQAYRYFNWGASGLQQTIEELPRVLREFLKGGIPLRDTASYDITPKL